MKVEYKFNFGSKTTPFPHQVEAVDYLQRHEAIALFDEQGLGKTKIVLDALINNLQDKIIDAAIIICRKNLIQNWQDEISTHSYLNSIILRGSSKEKGIKFMGFSHFYIINYESVISEVERLKMFLGIKKFAIVLDESHAIKNPDAQTTKSIFQLANLAKKRIIVSGTPVANKPEDLWSQFFFLDNGKLLGDDYSKFKSIYTANLRRESKFVISENFKQLRSLIESNSIRRKKNNVLELPEKIFVDKYVHLGGIQLQMYNQVRDELYLEIQNHSGEFVIDESEDFLKKLLRLAQIASNPRLLDQSYKEIPAKFPMLQQLIAEIVQRDEKVIIWSCFVENIRELNKEFQEYGAQMLYGDVPIKKRNIVLNKFKTDQNCKVLIANPAAAKEGLTLTVANNAIYLDRNFNLVDYLQSQDRIHRISQTKECKIIKLVAKDTIDEYIDEILKRKQHLAGFVQGDIDEMYKSGTLTKEELLIYLGGN